MPTENTEVVQSEVRLYEIRPPQGIIDERYQSERSFTSNAYDPSRTKVAITPPIISPHVPGNETYEFGCLYPFKGFIYPQVCHAVHTVKRVIMMAISILRFKPFASVALSLFIIPKLKYIFLWLVVDAFNKWCYVVLRDYILKERLFCTSARELYRAGIKYAKGYGPYKREIVEKFTITICMIWEYDNSYRYRGQDLFGILNKKEFLKRPLKEFLRSWDIGIDREMAEATIERRREFIKGKKGAIGKRIIVRNFIIAYALIFRKSFKEFVTVISSLNFDLMKLDHADLYMCSNRSDYHFDGKNFFDRMNERIAEDRKAEETRQQIIKNENDIKVKEASISKE